MPSKLFSSGPGIGGSGGTSAAVALPDTLSQTLRELQENHPTKVLTYTTSASKQLQERRTRRTSRPTCTTR